MPDNTLTPKAPDPIQDQRSIQLSYWTRLTQSLGIYLAVILLAIIGSIIDPAFLSPSHLLEMFAAEAQFLAIAILGASLVTYSGKMADLSIPSVMACSGFITIVCLKPFGFIPALALGLLSGAFIGLINGLIIGYLKLNPIIWTLSMNFILDGILRWTFEGKQVYPENLAFLKINEIHTPIFLILFLFIVFNTFLNSSTLGLQIKWIGASEKVAKASGVPCEKITTWVFILCSFTAALAGICYCSSAKLATFDTGIGYDFKVVTAIVLGGMSLQGGEGYLRGAMGGLILITFLESIMNRIGIGPYDQEILKGMIFIAVVGLSSHLAKKAGRHD